MKNNKLGSSMFSQETLDSMEMAEVLGGAAELNVFCKKNYCENAKCVDACGTKCSDCGATVLTPSYHVGL